MLAGVSSLALLALISVSHSAHTRVELEGDKGQVDTVKRDNGSGTKSASAFPPLDDPLCPFAFLLAHALLTVSPACSRSLQRGVQQGHP